MTTDIFNDLISKIARVRDGDHEAYCRDGGDYEALSKLQGVLEEALSEIRDELHDIGQSY